MENDDTTPTDAQPKAARPVGDEVLREGSAYIDSHLDAIQERPVIPAKARIAHALRASHPTTGQETVATPRDGGVREARWGVEDTGDAIWVGPMRSDGCKIDRVVYFKDDLGLHRKEYVAQVKADARLIVDGVNSALSAPGSAGSGEALREVLSDAKAYNHVKRISWADDPCLKQSDDLINRAEAELNSLDVLQHEQARGLLIRFVGVIDDIWNDEPADVPALRKLAEVARTFLASLPTPATTAETRGPAEGAR